jgi:hypothetical protein
VQLRNFGANAQDEEGGEMAIVESADTTESSPECTKTAKPPARSSETPFAPSETPARMEEIKFKRQQEVIDAWIGDPRHVADAACRHALELYAQLTDSEFLYVSDLQSTYDEARCFFLQWVLGKEIKELVNSARISAVQAGRKFTWVHARAEVLRSLTDITYTVRFLALARLKRQSGTAAKLWISQVLTRKALLEDPKLPAPIVLPEALYLELLVGQMSAQETTVFDCPSIGDDLSAKDGRGRYKYSLERIKRSIDDCSNPPHFRGVKTPVTDILDQSDPKITKEKRDQTKDQSGNDKASTEKGKQKRDQTKNPANAHLARRPVHEQPAKFPTGLKRPDLDATVDGNTIASEAQRQLYDDIKRGNCTRCHKGSHIRRDCKDPKAKWEEKFDKEKEKYWESVLKWQARATPGSKPVSSIPPTLHAKPAAKPEQRASSIASDSDEDDTPTFTPLHYLMTIDDDDSDDDGEASAIIASLEEVTMTAAAPNPAHAPPRASPPVSPFYQDDYVESYLNTVDELTLQSVRTILSDVERQLQSPSLQGRPALDGITPDIITTVTLATLTDNPFFTVLHRDRTHAIIRLPTGRIVSCHAQDVDGARTAYLPPPSEAQVAPPR